MKIEIVNFYEKHEDDKPTHQALYLNGNFIVDWGKEYIEVNKDILETAEYRNFWTEDVIREYAKKNNY